MMREAVLVFAFCVLSALSVARDCPLPTIAEIETVLPALLLNADHSQSYSPDVTEGSVQYVCLAQGSMIDTYKEVSLIATFTPNPGEPEQTNIFTLDCNSGTWTGVTNDGLDPPPNPAVTRTDCYQCLASFNRCRRKAIIRKIHNNNHY